VSKERKIKKKKMAEITYLGKTYNCRAGESILEAFLRQGVDLPFSCRSGVCQVCLQRAVSGQLPEGAQKGLKESLAAKNYFLPCICRPERDLEFAPPAEDDLYFPAVVAAKEQLAKDIFRIHLEPTREAYYRSGQFINLRRPDGLSRSYSLASVPGEDYYLELHVKRMQNGAMSNWLIDELEVNSEIDIQGPNGNCFYSHRNPDQNMLLVGTGTGLAPLLGIVRTALASGHSGHIYLYHGSSKRDGLYLVDELRELAAKVHNFHYVPCVTRESAPKGFQQARAHALAFAVHDSLAEWRVHLAGNPDMVDAAMTMAAKAGADSSEIFADSFVLKDLRSKPRIAADGSSTTPDSDRREFPPDPEMWAALKEGEMMGAILTDFYTRVFDDPVLSPYFTGVTKQRLIEKVYSFMRQIFTGEKMYFGDRPRNAHHWMVIPDEVFDYREALMRDCMRRQGLAEAYIKRWQTIEESFRSDIVKAKPFGRVVDGVELPVEGFGHTVLEVGAICDSCARVIEPGEEVRYHLRLGHIYCSDCNQT
jgi:ferredoxin-NADP reductase/ferredoxin/truncated hemoglobin YjbI